MSLPANYLLPNQATSPDLTARTNQDQWFFAKITASGGSAPVRHTWVEVLPVPITSGSVFVVKDGGRVGVFTGPNPAVALDGSTVANNTYVLMRRGSYDTGGSFDWVYLILATVSSSRVLVQITSRTYPGGGTPFALYSCNIVTDATTPSALTYTATVAGPDFYNLNDVDLPVGLACWISKSDNGSWYLNDNDTRVDVIQVTGTVPDANGLLDGVLRRYNDGTHVMEDRGAIKVLDISGP